MDRIVVINPNSNEAVTRAMDAALDPLRFADGPEIESVTNPDGPPGIESQRDADRAAGDVVRMVEARGNAAGAFVVACFSDPGLFAAREATDRPVFGIAESGVLTALSLGERFGILAILANSVPRHMRYIRALGLGERLAGDLPVGLSVAELADEDRTFARMAAVGAELRDDRGADVLVMGCAGMARYRARLEERLGVAVVDPAQAAVSMAVAAIRLGQTNGARRRAP